KFPEPGISIQRQSGYTLLMGIGHLSLLNKATENNWGLSLVNIRVFPMDSFSPHDNPIPETNNHLGNAWRKRPGCLGQVCVPQ
ncbi:MAG: hypothetical protein ACXACF_09950, partial [Candidatus Hermodarchaeia archaeon]